MFLITVSDRNSLELFSPSYSEFQGCSEFFMIVHKFSGLFKYSLGQDCSEFFRIVQNFSGLFRIAQDCSGLSRIVYCLG